MDRIAGLGTIHILRKHFLGAGGAHLCFFDFYVPSSDVMSIFINVGKLGV